MCDDEKVKDSLTFEEIVWSIHFIIKKESPLIIAHT